MHAFDDAVVIPAMDQQLGLLLGGDEQLAKPDSSGRYFSAATVELDTYDHIIVGFSAGKDSLACLLHLMDLGADMSRVELWHHDVDGREGSTLMDWAFMADYNRKLAEAFNLPLYFSWLEGGFEGEMLKKNSFSRPHHVETPDGLIILERDTTRAKPGTRMRFTQVAANLAVRWCSSSLKVDVARRALNNQPRFMGKKILFITGERREESPNRARYFQLEPHACDRRTGRLARHVDAWRPVLDWPEEQVWDALRRHGVIAPVPYRLGWGRSSCRTCIFNDASIWATLREYFPGSLDALADYEQRFDTTISRDRISIIDVSHKARPLDITDLQALEQAVRPDYALPVLTDPSQWKLPAGAYARSGSGPS